MPIYVYRCENCGLEKDVLQKIADVPLSTCPQCHQESFAKQLTAPGFHLKGSGWYATDFKGKGDKAPPAPCQGAASESCATCPAAAAATTTAATTTATTTS
ncbi:MAG: zinc ribbon domain-containing protein [Rhodocyclaceae bacterium]|nr:zinc ribbon domain-containing protein [Rhodocyclaceae bacterium]